MRPRVYRWQVYRIVTITLPGNHRIMGYINHEQMVERVRTWLDNNTMIEAVYRDYRDFRGLKVPTIQFQNRGGAFRQIVIMTDATVLEI